jgi:hypothetical protein
VVPSAKSRLAFWGGWLAIIGMQVGLLAYFGGEHLISDKPYAGLDFDTHITQTWRVLEGIEGWGQTWVYDVQLLAGVPQGVIFDADNKGWEIWTWVLHRLGLAQGQAFNTYVIFSHLAVAPVVYLSARLHRLRPWAALLAAGLAVLYWNFDSFSHWLWYVGMSAYGIAGYAFLVPLGLFYRWVSERRPWQIAGTTVALALCHLNHPYTFFIMVVPMVALWLRALPTLRWSAWPRPRCSSTSTGCSTRSRSGTTSSIRRCSPRRTRRHSCGTCSASSPSPRPPGSSASGRASAR